MLYSFIVEHIFCGNKIRRTAVENLGLKNGDRVLDLACGSGKNFGYIIDKIGKHGKLIGHDYSKEMLNLAQKLIERNNWSNIDLKYGDASKLNYKDRFDAVICTFGLTVIPEWKKVLNNIIKATKRGGRICIVDEVYTKDFFGFFNWFVWFDSKIAGANPKREIMQELKAKFRNIKIRKFLFGTIFTAMADKK